MQSLTQYLGSIELISSTLKQTLKAAIEYLGEKLSQSLSKEQQASTGIKLVIVGFHIYLWQKYSYWSSRKIKGPQPLPIFGNYLSYLINPRFNLDIKWRDKYGRLYGVYQGTRPVLVCSDAEVLKKICIKDFDKFPNHFFVGVRNKYQKNFLIFIEDDHWRGVRSIITPTFASGKIKTMFKVMNGKSHELIKRIDLQISQKDGLDKDVFEAKKMIAPFSIGTAVSCFYGINLDQESSERTSSSSGDNTSTNFASRIPEAFRARPLRILISNILPLSFLKWINLSIVPEKSVEFFFAKSKAIVAHRRKAPSSHNDYLKFLLDAKAEDVNDVATSDSAETHHALVGETSVKGWRTAKLSEEEVVCSAMMLMMVATETTSTLLSSTLFLLSYHPKVQEKLFGELQKITDTDEHGYPTFDYDKLTSCSYLDCVVSESLRCYSPAVFMDRVAREDYYLKEYDLLIEKGTIVNLAFQAIHRDPEYWPEPDKFIPERFADKNKHNIVSGSYCPFGIGPRSCVGFRFALTEVKVCLATILTTYKIIPAPGTKYPPEPKGIFLINELGDIRVRMQRR